MNATARKHALAAAALTLLGGAAGGLIVDQLHNARIDHVERDILDIDKAFVQQVRWHARLSGNFDLLREQLRNAGVIMLTRNPDADWAAGDKYDVSPRRCSCSDAP